MSTTIWKHKLTLKPLQTIKVPQGAEFLHVAEQYGDITVWFRCDPSRSIEERQVAICGTGGAVPSAEEGQHIGTGIAANGVWHVFVATTASHDHVQDLYERRKER